MHAVLLPRLLAISLAGFVLFGVTMSLVLTVSNRWPTLSSIATWIDVADLKLDFLRGDRFALGQAGAVAERSGAGP